MQHSEPLMTELIPTINEIVKYGLQPSLTIADREKVLEKNLIKITSQQRLPTVALRFRYRRFKAVYATCSKGRDIAAKRELQGGLFMIGTAGQDQASACDWAEGIPTRAQISARGAGKPKPCMCLLATGSAFYNQLFMLIPSISLKCLSLVTTTNLKRFAIAAIQISFSGIGFPFFLNAALIFP